MELGTMIHIYEETDIPAAFWYATEAGFRRGQVTSFIHGVTADEVRQMGVAARNAGFHVDAVGCYINPLRPDDSSLHGVDGLDWRTLAENMGMMNGVERIVCWSGTLGKTLDAPNLLNAEEETFNSLYIALSGMREQVRGLPVQILLEPFVSHVLDDAAACVRMARKFPSGDVKVVLDAPNLLTVRGFAAQKALIPDLIARMAPAIGLVHLKDFSLDAEGKRVFVAPGKGVLDFGMQLRAISQFLSEVPLVIENVTTIDEMRAAREFVQGVLKDCGL
ncbi:MAG: sugar phosphate isomerase/epimerase family protein [Janthinobacterium lividum]